MRINQTIGTLADEYHIASANTATNKCFEKMPELQPEAAFPKALHLVDAPAVALKPDDEIIEMRLEEAVTSRTSSRSFSSNALPKSKLAKLLYLGNGVRTVIDHGNEAVHKANAPSSGGLGSVEIFCCVLNVANLDSGIYHFDKVHHELRLVRNGHFGQWLRSFALPQKELAQAPVILILTSAIGRLNEKYGLRAYRLGLLDAGHVSQNIYLAATAMNLACCAISGFVDDEFNEVIDVDGLDTCAVLGLAVGYGEEG